jgi:hypothetical protein
MKKNKFIKLVMGLVLAVSATSCSETGMVGLTDEGTLRLSSLGVEVSNVETVVRKSRSEATVDLNPYIVTIYNQEQPTAKLREWTYAEMPEVIALPVGKYRVDVCSHQVQKAEWDKPLFKGSKEFEIEGGKIVDLGVVTCKFSSIKVTVNFTDALKEQMGTDCKVSVVANDEGELEFTTSETRSGYFEALEGSTTLVATFTGTVKGNEENVYRIYDNVEAGQHYIITFSLKDENPTPPQPSGSVEVGNEGINVDVSYTEENLTGSISADDDILDSSDRPGQETPEEGGEDNSETDDNTESSSAAATFYSEYMSLTSANTVSELSALIGKDPKNPDHSMTVEISCPKGIENLVVKIISDGLTPEVLTGVGLTDEFDLAYPGSYEVGLNGLGFPTGNDVIGKTAVTFDITQFISLLGIYPGQNTFRLTVTDSTGASSVLNLQINS